MKKKHRISYEDRLKIEKLLKLGISVSRIASEVDVHRATLYKEIKRGGVPYSAEVAQRKI